MCTGSALRQAVDDLQELDLATLSDTELEELTLEVDLQRDRLSGEHARLVAAVAARRSWTSDGSRSCAAWLARNRNGCRASASAALRLGESLAQMPLVDAALRAGEITAAHARLLGSCLRFKPDVFAESEAELLSYAKRFRWQGFVMVCARWREVVDPDGAEDRADKLRDRRHLILHRRPDGSLDFQSGLLDPIGAEAFLAELESIERELFEDDWAEAKARYGEPVGVSRLRRTQAMRRADALVEMAYRSRTAPKDGKRPQPLVTIYVDYETVTGRLCELASGVPITPGQLVPIITQADIERVVFGPRSRVIDLGVRERFFTGGLRRAIQLRDRHCQFPGCTEPAMRCQVDHKVDYADGGETTQDNGELLCGIHNRTKHRHPPPEDPTPVEDHDDDDDEGEHETDEEIARQHRRCRERINELLVASGTPPRKRPPAFSRKLGVFTSPFT